MTRKRYVFEETGEVRPPRYGEWHLVGSCDEIFMCTLDGADKPYPILTRRVEEVVCTGLSDHVRTQCPTCGEFTIIPAPPEPKAPPFGKVSDPWLYHADTRVFAEALLCAFCSAHALTAEDCELCMTYDKPTNTGRVWFRKRETPPVEPEPSLRPCPFCGGKAKYDGSRVICEDCGASSDNGLMQSEARAAWNRRTP